MSVSQERPGTPPTDYGPSLTRPTSDDEEDKENELTTVEVVNPAHTSVEIQQVEDDSRKSPISPRIGKIILSYWIICVCIIPIALMASPLIIPIILLKVMDGETKVVIYICSSIEVFFGLLVIWTTYKGYSRKFTILNVIGIFAGKYSYVVISTWICPKILVSTEFVQCKNFPRLMMTKRLRSLIQVYLLVATAAASFWYRCNYAYAKEYSKHAALLSAFTLGAYVINISVPSFIALLRWH
ncbi:1956_t:CDS:2 [Paraglomus occultum]|uniref:1956_t:CDS:1 n=1 Tax=Paraglomus occultum TaxID=144539 RepID=A0A9N9ABB1_9GLOM|nr:1956_t:CDS:2 [Paraglomus occultum]